MTFVVRSVKTAGDGSERFWKTLITPLFSVTNTRPSEAKATLVGLTKPLSATDSVKLPFSAVAVWGAVPTAAQVDSVGLLLPSMLCWHVGAVGGFAATGGTHGELSPR